MASKFNEEDSQLIASLHALSKHSPKLVKSSTYNVQADPSIVVRSWRMDEFKYTKIPSPFPTLARGLFTTELPQKEQDADADAGGHDAEVSDEKQHAKAAEKNEAETQYRIVARGYDKFFNIGEVPWTTWEALEKHTAAPYTLTLKSNGCIIFIAALTPKKLLVTSKHSVGPVEGSEMSHAQAGEMWLNRYLEEKGKDQADLASQLWENNWTAIAELCDDSFEEHVLGYPPEKTGLHLHGLNECSKHFKTLPQADVDAFAEQWGFIKTASIVRNTINEVRSFTQECAEKGEWEGEAVEGFVVRTHVTQPPTDGRESAQGASPYPPGSTFFFKVKFDEPYLMYRDWREVTKTLLSQHSKNQPLNAKKLPKSKMKRKETQVYVKWVIREIERDPGAFDGYCKGRGIIATRERFLEYLKTSEGGNELVTTDEIVADGPKDKPKKTIIVPVAIPGCGKTSVAIALAQLFGFGHTQNDNFVAKKPGPFLNSVFEHLGTHDVVIADKNNHLHQHRQQLQERIKNFGSPVHLLALDWLSSIRSDVEAAFNVCGDRIVIRGNHHQKLRGGQHEAVLQRFIKEAEELDTDEVDECIDMRLEDTFEDVVQSAVDGLVHKLGLPKPSNRQILDALQTAHDYHTQITQNKEKRNKGKYRYYAFRPGFDLKTRVDAVFNHVKPQNASADSGSLGPDDALSNEMSKPSIGQVDNFWTKLKADKRVAKEPHVTLVHCKMLPGAQEFWDDAQALAQLNPAPRFKLRLGHLLWNERVMALTVDGVEVVAGGNADGDESSMEQARQFLETRLGECAKQGLHITIGTAAADIPPLEAKDIVEEWRKANGQIDSIRAIPVPEGNRVVYGPVKGLNS